MKGEMEEPTHPPLGEIRVIVGGTFVASSSRSKKTYLRVVQKVQLAGHPPRISRLDEPTITFTDKDARRLHNPYDDAIVITLTIVNYTTRRLLVDNGSSTDILYYLAFQQVKIDKELLRPAIVPSIGFGGMEVLLVGTIYLPVVVSAYP